MSYGKTYVQERLNFEGAPVKDHEVKSFALALLLADTEDEVIELLNDAGYWDNCDGMAPVRR